MSLAQTLRSVVPLIIGLVVGGVGVSLFTDSLTGDKGSPEERVAKLEVELKESQNRVVALEASGGTDRFGDTRRSLADGARSLTDKLRSGQPVSPDDIFRATKPFMRDLAPLFDRIRLRDQRKRIDSMTGELARKYDLSEQQQTALKVWFDGKAQEEAKRWTDLLGRDDTGLEQMMRAARDVRPDEGLDKFMEGVLSGEKLTSFKTERMTERAERLQRDTDMKVPRLDSLVKLDDVQRDKVFADMARNSRDYDPSMALEGTTGELAATPVGNKHAAMLAILTPDQRTTYDGERQRRREEAEKDMQAIGMTLPPNWEMLDDEDFK